MVDTLTDTSSSHQAKIFEADAEDLHQAETKAAMKSLFTVSQFLKDKCSVLVSVSAPQLTQMCAVFV